MNEKTISKSVLSFVAPGSRRFFMSAAAKAAAGGAVATLVYGQGTGGAGGTGGTGTGGTGTGGTGTGATGTGGTGTGAGTGNSALVQADIDILNYVLTLAYLEATFYNQFLGSPTGATPSSTAVGTVTGNPKGFTNADAVKSNAFSGVGSTVESNLYGYITAIRDHQFIYVANLRAMIQQAGGTSIQACSYNFTNVTSFDTFLQTAQTLANAQVSALIEAVANLQSVSARRTVAALATTKARHAAYLNLLQSGSFSATLPAAATPGVLTAPGVGTSPFMTPYDMSVSQAQGIALIAPYLGTCATPLPGSTAIATFSPSITSPFKTGSVTLNATPSSSISGPATFQYSVSPGGRVPAILQTPNSSQATIQFVNGPGIYNLLLTITDSNGQTSTMPVTLNYQP
ncbi:MAG TPA: ferritin-like domain-containing protein [Bryobacteraceae bacterium]|nr:ferritin-like domain-containing protein [Bryobacteraceae bacterium]